MPREWTVLKEKKKKKRKLKGKKKKKDEDHLTNDHADRLIRTAWHLFLHNLVKSGRRKHQSYFFYGDIHQVVRRSYWPPISRGSNASLVMALPLLPYQLGRCPRPVANLSEHNEDPELTQVE